MAFNCHLQYCFLVARIRNLYYKQPFQSMKFNSSDHCGRIKKEKTSSEHIGRTEIRESSEHCGRIRKVVKQAKQHKPVKNKQTKPDDGWWTNVKMRPKDPVFGANEAFTACDDDRKVNLTIGAYRDENGAPYILPSVRKAEVNMWRQKLGHEYVPLGGMPKFNKLAVEFAFGEECPKVMKKEYAAVQAAGGTGALRVGADFIHRFFRGKKNIYVPDPTWPNHILLFSDAGLRVRKYHYYNPAKNGFDFAGMLRSIRKIPPKSVILLHACAHNPTGADPSPDQWERISKILKDRKILPFFDMAYQGFASGDFENDAYAVRQFVRDGHYVLLAQSFAKNIGLYGQRVGCFSVITSTVDEAERILSHLKMIIRGQYGTPSLHGGRIAIEVMENPEIRSIWECDMKHMANRIHEARESLVAHLEKAGSTCDWSHITRQIGMFCFLGITEKQVDRLQNEFFVFGTRDSRISMAGINPNNVAYVAKALHKVTK